MAGQAAYKTKIKIGGTAVPTTDEAFTMLSPNNYSVTDITRQVIDRFTAVVVSIDATPIDDSLYSVNYLFGKVTTQVAVPDGVMTVTYSYIPTADVACSTAYTLDDASDILDQTCMQSAQANGGLKVKLPGLREITASLESIAVSDHTLRDIYIGRTAVLLEFDFGGLGTDMARGWFFIENDNYSGDVGGLENESLSFQLDAQDEALKLRSFAYQFE
jgi:hypothetical protein